MYRFDPSTGTVEQLAALPRPVAHAPLVALNGSLYLIGGDGSAAVWRITPDGTVTLAGHLPHPLASAAALAVGRSAYVFGGDGSDAVLRLTPKTRWRNGGCIWRGGHPGNGCRPAFNAAADRKGCTQLRDA